MLSPIQDGVATLTRQLRLSDHLRLVDYVWESELGGLAKRVKIVALDRDTLVVQADSAPAMQEIALRRKELVRRLNRHFPSEFIKMITVRVG
jgi:hypothetical protein